MLLVLLFFFSFVTIEDGASGDEFFGFLFDGWTGGDGAGFNVARTTGAFGDWSSSVVGCVGSIGSVDAVCAWSPGTIGASWISGFVTIVATWFSGTVTTADAISAWFTDIFSFFDAWSSSVVCVVDAWSSGIVYFVCSWHPGVLTTTLAWSSGSINNVVSWCSSAVDGIIAWSSGAISSSCTPVDSFGGKYSFDRSCSVTGSVDAGNGDGDGDGSGCCSVSVSVSVAIAGTGAGAAFSVRVRGNVDFDLDFNVNEGGDTISVLLEMLISLWTVDLSDFRSAWVVIVIIYLITKPVSISLWHTIESLINTTTSNISIIANFIKDNFSFLLEMLLIGSWFALFLKMLLFGL